MAKTQGGTRQKVRTRTREPKLFHVVFHNDDVTTMEFVVALLCVVFFKSTKEAEELMLTVHRKGRAVVGTYSLDIAQSKRNKAIQMAKIEGFPLNITCEEA